MQIGINWTNGHHLPQIKDLITQGRVDFCEILIDNFLHFPPETIRRELGDIPVAFHIMHSHFLERDLPSLQGIAKQIRRFKEVLNPIYLSDHIAQFTFNGKSSPFTLEINYAQNTDHAISKILLWQELLNTTLYLENFPSVLTKSGESQVDFFEKVTHLTGANILFDISNAFIAFHNCLLDPLKWSNLIRKTSHFHIGSYSISEKEPYLAIDTHDQKISQETRYFLKSIRSFLDQKATIVVERDHNLDITDWLEDLQSVGTSICLI